MKIIDRLVFETMGLSESSKQHSLVCSAYFEIDARIVYLKGLILLRGEVS